MAIKKYGVWWMGNGLMDGWVGGWWMRSKDGLRIAHSNQKLKQRNIFFVFRITHLLSQKNMYIPDRNK